MEHVDVSKIRWEIDGVGDGYNWQPPFSLRHSELIRLLDDLEMYFDERADADQPSGAAPIPNEELLLLDRVRREHGRFKHIARVTGQE